MAVLVIKIENEATLLMNEFFDYDGQCYALSCPRNGNPDQTMNMEDFYEATVQSTCMKDVLTVFALENGSTWKIAGWYRHAEVYKHIKRPSFFLEGNVTADSRNVCMIPDTEQLIELQLTENDRVYEVIEKHDSRYSTLVETIDHYCGKNIFQKYTMVDNLTDSRIMKDKKLCMQQCQMMAERLMNDQCRDLTEIKTMAHYAEQLCILEPGAADGYYYLAMADYQSGHVKKGMKAIEKALRIEPDAPDLMAMKAYLLVSMGYTEQAADLFHKAFLVECDEDYLLLEGRTRMFMHQIEKAYQCFKQINDRKLLEDAGIHLKDMEKKWPFMAIRNFHIKDLFPL